MSNGSWQDVPGEGETLIDEEDIIEIELDDDDEPAKQANHELDEDPSALP